MKTIKEIETDKQQLAVLIHSIANRSKNYHPGAGNYRGVNKKPERAAQIKESMIYLDKFQSVLDEESYQRICNFLSSEYWTNHRPLYERSGIFDPHIHLNSVVSYLLKTPYHFDSKMLQAAYFEVENFLGFLYRDHSFIYLLDNLLDQNNIQLAVREIVIYWLRNIKVGEDDNLLNNGLDGLGNLAPQMLII